MKSQIKSAGSKSPSLKGLAPRQKLATEAISRLLAQNPNPRCELYYKSPFQLLVSVVLSAQTTDKMVNQCMTSLYDQGLDIGTILEWGEAGLLKHIRPIGLAPTKAKNVVKLAGILREHFQDEIPSTRDELIKLPGVGRKTANVVLGELFRQPTLAVDTHVLRVTKRLGLHSENNAEKAELELLKLIPAEFLPEGHHVLVLHGRYICKAIKPDCERCAIQDLCHSHDKRLPQR